MAVPKVRLSTAGSRTLVAFASCLCALALSVMTLFTPDLATAEEIWITDKVITAGLEHYERAALPRLIRSPGGNFILNWHAQDPADLHSGHSAEFDLNGNRLRKLITFTRTSGPSYRTRLVAAVSPDSTVIAYTWGSTNYDDTLLYQGSCWYWAIAYADGVGLFSPVRLDSFAVLTYTARADRQQIDFLDDTTVVVFWNEWVNPGEVHPEGRYFQRVSTSGILIGNRLHHGPGYWDKFICDEADTCQTYDDNVHLGILEDTTILIAYDAGAYIGTEIQHTMSVAERLDADLTRLPGVDILMCDNYPCPIFDRFWGVSQAVDMDVFESGGFAVAVNIGFDIHWSNFPAGRAIDSLFHPASPVVGASDHNPGDYWFSPRVACGPNDEYVVVWSDRGETINAYRDLWAQRFTRAGEAIGVNQRLNGRADLLGGNSGQIDVLYQDGHLVAVHAAPGRWVGLGDDEDPLLLQVMPWNKIGFFSPGDADQSGEITATDIIRLVNYVFKSGDAPKPQASAGDVTGDCAVNATDLIHLVNYVFKSGAGPVGECRPILPYIP